MAKRIEIQKKEAQIFTSTQDLYQDNEVSSHNMTYSGDHYENT